MTYLVAALWVAAYAAGGWLGLLAVAVAGLLVDIWIDESQRRQARIDRRIGVRRFQRMQDQDDQR